MPTLGWLLFIPLKFWPPKAKAPFPLNFFHCSNHRPKWWDDVSPHAPPQPCLFYQYPSSWTPTLGWLLCLPMKFRPLKAMAPFPLYFFIVPIVSPNDGTMSPPMLHPGRASSINTPHCERRLSAGCCVFPWSFGHLRPNHHSLSFFCCVFILSPQQGNQPWRGQTRSRAPCMGP